MKNTELAMMSGVIQAAHAANMLGRSIQAAEDKSAPAIRSKRAKVKAARKANRKRMKSRK